MYTIRKSEEFHDQLEIQDASGRNLVLDIRLNVTPQVAKEYRALQVKLLNLQKQTSANSGDPEIVEQIGQAVSDALSLLFGAENLKRMSEFYGGDYVTMLSDVFPYIQEVIVPQFSALAEARKKQMRRRFR